MSKTEFDKRTALIALFQKRIVALTADAKQTEVSVVNDKLIVSDFARVVIEGVLDELPECGNCQAADWVIGFVGGTLSDESNAQLGIACCVCSNEQPFEVPQ